MGFLLVGGFLGNSQGLLGLGSNHIHPARGHVLQKGDSARPKGDSANKQSCPRAIIPVGEVAFHRRGARLLPVRNSMSVSMEKKPPFRGLRVQAQAGRNTSFLKMQAMKPLLTKAVPVVQDP